MARGSFSKRFPHFKLFLFLAVLIALPLTVFSANKVSTNSVQHATSTCATINQACGESNGVDCCQAQALTCSHFPNGTCISYALPAPTGLISHASQCPGGPGDIIYGSINFNWNEVKNTTGYILYYKYTTSGTTYLSVLVTNASMGASSHYPHYSLSIRSFNGRRLYWYVRAKNNYTTSANSKILETLKPYTSC